VVFHQTSTVYGAGAENAASAGAAVRSPAQKCAFAQGRCEQERGGEVGGRGGGGGGGDVLSLPSVCSSTESVRHR